MKKTIIIIASLLYTIGLSAQMQWGVRLGANRSRYTEPGPSKSLTAQWGATVGVTTYYTLTSWLDIQADLNYTQRNCKDETLIVDMDTEDFFRLQQHYLTLPIQLKFFHPIIIDGANIHFGPQLGLLLHRDDNLDISGDANPFDFGFTAGIGWLSPTGYFIDADFYLGLIPIYKSPYGHLEGFRNHSLQISVGKFF